MNILAGAKIAFEHRKKALESLVQLHGQQYFAKPLIPAQVQTVVTEERHVKHVAALNEAKEEKPVQRRRAL